MTSEIIIHEAQDCPFIGWGDSCTHPDACEEHGQSEGCVNPHSPPPPWCPLWKRAMLVRIGGVLRTARVEKDSAPTEGGE